MATTTEVGDQGPALFRLIISMLILSPIFVALRFWSRYVTIGNKTSMGRRFWWDDWMALASLPLAMGQLAVVLWWINIGLGSHTSNVAPENVTLGLKALYAEYFLYDIGISLPKLSALLFYARVFSVSNARIRWTLWAAASLPIAWIMFGVFSTIFQCNPIEKAWMPTEPGFCIDLYKWWLGSAISSVLIDVIILVLPLPLMWNLQLKPLRKFFIALVFLSGYCVIGISIGRLVAVSQVNALLDADIDFYTVPVQYWLCVEAPVSVISICLPSIFALIRRAIIYGPKAILTSQSTTMLSRRRTKASAIASTMRSTAPVYAAGHASSFERTAEALNPESNEYTADIRAMKRNESGDSSLGPDTIRVRNDVDVGMV